MYFLMNPSQMLTAVTERAAAIGGFTPFSSVDWPGMFAAVVFIEGCPWRCHYCHNPHLQVRDKLAPTYHWSALLEFLKNRQGLLDGVVFSGGEPLSDPRCLDMFSAVKRLGLKVAVHTAGMYPVRLQEALPNLDWVGLDIKTDAQAYDALTGFKKSATGVWRSLDVLLDGDVDFECRTTWSPDWLKESALLDLAQGLFSQGVRKYAIQRYRSNTSRHFCADLSPELIHKLSQLFEKFSYR